MSEDYRMQVLWLTNLPAPYRFPIWDQMSKAVDLKVVFLLKKKNWRNWPEPIGRVWKHSYLSLNSLQVSEYDIIPSFRGVKAILKNTDVAIIGGWESPIYIRAILKAKKKRIKVIQFYGSTSDSHRFQCGPIPFVRKRILQKTDLVVTISESSKKALIMMGISSEKIVTLFNPVDVSWFQSFANNHRTPVTSGHRYIYVGQLIERKNVATILRSFAAIRDGGDTLTIAGDGPLAQDLKNLAASLSIAGSVIFAGHRSQEEVAKLYAASNTFILASTNEVWGLVVNEALASGLHVIVSDKCGVADFVKDMKGVFISSTDQLTLQEAMQASSLQWDGHIEEPEILKFTPEKFADGIIQLL